MLLQLGDIGDNVKYLQYGLHILCCSPNGFDGEFGDGTLTAVKKFQSKYGLVSDGIVGDVTWNTLKNEITTIQSQLNKKGFNVGTVDGIAGAATYNGVISFQSKNGLTADGQVGSATWDILFDTISGGNSYSRILKVTSPLMYGEDIRAVQNKLNSLGYNAGTADGYYGNDTKNAVIKFQKRFAITADGIVGPTTWKYLFETGASADDILEVAGNIGLFENSKFTFPDFNKESFEVLLSMFPTISLKGVIGFSSTISGETTNSILNLNLTPKTITTNILNDLTGLNVKHNIDKDTLEASIATLTAKQNINSYLNYSVGLNNLGALEITVESCIPPNTSISFNGKTIKLGIKLYQRLIITIKPRIMPNPSETGLVSEITIPLYKPESEISAGETIIQGLRYTAAIGVVGIIIVAGAKLVAAAIAGGASGGLGLAFLLAFCILK